MNTPTKAPPVLQNDQLVSGQRQKFSKFIRHPERYGLQLQERDLDILQLVYDYRFIPSDHVVQLIEGSERKILDRLKKLFNHKYLERMCDRRIRTHSGSEKMVYALTGRAAQLLVDERGLDFSKVNWASKNRTVTERHIKHTLMIGKFRTAITLAAAGREDMELLFWKEHRGTGQQLNPELLDSVTLEFENGREERRKIVPDAFLGLEDSEFEHFLYLEADRSTMTNDRFKKKLTAYWSWWKKGGSKHKHQVDHFRVLTITPSAARRDNLRAVAKEATPVKGGSGMFWFACEKDYSITDPTSILGDIWVTPRDDKKHSLLE